MSNAVFCLKKKKGESIFVGIIHDLTASKRTEQALRQGAARLLTLIETAVDGLILINARGLVLISNLFFFNDTATTEIYTLSLHDALPISGPYQQEHDRYISNYLDTREPKIIGI